VGFFLLSSTNHFHQSKLYTASVNLSSKVYSINQSYEQYIGLQEENSRLRTENAELREELYSRPLNTSNLSKTFETITATVIMSTFNKGNNFVLINRGQRDGITNEMGVLSINGVVGRVIHVSEKYSAIMPMLHSQSVTSVRLKNQDYFGRCKWNQYDPDIAQMLDVPNHVDITAGDTVVTRGSNGLFPNNQMVGVVISAEKDPSEGFQEINLRLSTNFQNLKTVYVIKNNFRQELDSISNTVKAWEGN
jgi:rod shape-determining protein MreC